MLGPPANDTSPQISGLVTRNISALKTFVLALGQDKTQTSRASSHLARFKIWAGCLGAHRRSGTRSLEYRLRDASLIRNHVISLLGELSSAITEGQASVKGKDVQVGSGDDSASIPDELAEYFQDQSEPETEIDQILDEIGHVVDCLLRLSITISNPAPHDQFKSRVGLDSVPVFEAWYTKHVQEKFAGASTKTAARLGRAMARQHQYFQYREDHSNRLAAGLDEDAADHGEQATTVASPLPEHLRDSKASGVKEFPDLDDGKSDISGTSYAPSIANPGHLRVPPIPKGYTDGPFKCPFCHMILSIDDRNAWKKHMFRDLRPYICLSETCQALEQQFARRGDWSKHMKREHWIIWQCSFGCPGEFHTAEDFRSHTMSHHGQEVPQDRLDALQNLSTSPDLSKARGACALCLDFDISSARQYDSHVGGHLEQLALFTLPSQGDEETDRDDTSDERLSSHNNLSTGQNDENASVVDELAREHEQDSEGSLIEVATPEPPTPGHYATRSVRHGEAFQNFLSNEVHDEYRPSFARNLPFTYQEPSTEPAQMDGSSAKGGLSDELAIGKDHGQPSTLPDPGQDGHTELPAGFRSAKASNDGHMWTEVKKDLIVREAIEELGYEYEETEEFFYIMDRLSYDDVLQLVDVSDEIRRVRKARARELEFEREGELKSRWQSTPPRARPVDGGGLDSVYKGGERKEGEDDLRNPIDAQ